MHAYVLPCRYLKYGTIADIDVLKECCRINLGDMTFQEAYNKTGRILNITVNSRTDHGIPRLLNYLTSPDVVIWTAACASCALFHIFDEVEVSVGIVFYTPCCMPQTDSLCNHRTFMYPCRQHSTELRVFIHAGLCATRFSVRIRMVSWSHSGRPARNGRMDLWKATCPCSDYASSSM